MKTVISFTILAGLALTSACGGSMTSPNATGLSTSTALASVPLDQSTLSFSLLTTDKAAVTTYRESGFGFTAQSGDWQARSTYGNPAPFVQFFAGGGTVVGEALITMPNPTLFRSVDLYSSTTAIPYVIKGLRGGAEMFTLSGTAPNTFGAFATILNTHAVEVDAVSITLTNATTGGNNPMGFDNFSVGTALARQPSQYALSGTVTDNTTGTPIPGATVKIATGPNLGLTMTTDGSGRYAFPSLTEGFFAVTSVAPMYLTTSQTLQFSGNQTLPFGLNRDPRQMPVVPPPAGATVISFSDLSVNNAPVTRYTESGFTIAAEGAAWQAVTTYGRPAPFIEFFAEPSQMLSGRVTVTAGGVPFSFVSVELYSSVTRFPYTITGALNGTTVFSVSDELPNPMGNFRQVLNAAASALIDTLSIQLTNPGVAVRNPVGLDNMVVVK